MRACFMESCLKRAGSSIFNRQIKTAKAGTTPRPRERRQTARRWLSPKLLNYNQHMVENESKICNYIQKRTRGTNAETTNPKSIMQSRREISMIGRSGDIYNRLVARANHRCWAFLLIPGSSDCSDAETDPQGYSAPTPMPIKKLNNLREHSGRTPCMELYLPHCT